MFEDILQADFARDRPTLLCLSHLRWDFVFQRPQQLMTRLAANNNVLFWEEPIFASPDAAATVERRTGAPGLTVLTPRLPEGLTKEQQDEALEMLLRAETQGTNKPLIRWFYTPMMLSFARGIEAECTVYDCMDELSGFDFAPAELKSLESELLAAADLVFTGGHSLYEAKSVLHPRVHAFPSSVDTSHFRTAREVMSEPSDQPCASGPRLGFVGVIDERFDRDLLKAAAAARPDWTFVMVGPVVKIDPDSLPVADNIHYLGGKQYAELPAYLAGWDVALMPFAINAATKFISPTKTPEYLAAGKPVVSTPIVDVVRQYGELEAVAIASTAREFIEACERMIALDRAPGAAWHFEVEMALSQMSWDNVVREMSELIHGVLRAKGLKDLYFDYLIV
ncbi:MAG: glycosyltransferase family 1 protein, partial [Sphingomicrobium sp.]